MWWASGVGRAAAAPPAANRHGPRGLGVPSVQMRGSPGGLPSMACKGSWSHPYEQSPRVPPPRSRTQPWPYVRAVAGVSAGIAARVARGATRSASLAALADPGPAEVADALQSIREEDGILRRYLDAAQPPWPEDYANLQPLMGKGKENAPSDLQRHVVNGFLAEVDYTRRQLDNGCLVLVSCDVQGAGFVCGLGFAPTETEADQLAAQQALQRMAFPQEHAAELRRCSEAVKGHEHHAGAEEPSRQAAEALEALENYLKEVTMTAFCPCGTAWMASVSAMAFTQRVLASSADWEQEIALALAAEMFISRLRWAIRVPAEEPHEPREWARTWKQRAPSASKPWSGVARRAAGETCWLPELGGEGGQDKLQELLGPKEDRETRARALQETLGARTHEEIMAEKKLRDQTRKPRQELDGFELGEDRRRPELVGKLPVEQIREELGKTLGESQVVMVSGGTGSGKTTQLPQFLLDDWRSKEGNGDLSVAPKIVCTQPRRIAAISVAERVAWERGEGIGRTVGYSVHGSEASARPHSMGGGTVEFVTVGTLLRRAVHDALLQDCDIVVVDEVHERDMLTDFLLILLREVLPRRPSLKLVLMSATLDVEKFTNYFNGCPILEVPSGPRFPVEEIYLDSEFMAQFSQTDTCLLCEATGREKMREDLEKDGNPLSLSWWGAGGSNNDRTTMELVVEVLSELVPELHDEDPTQSILVFLPGWADIRQVEQSLKDTPDADRMYVLPLHSMLPKREQAKVFEKAPRGLVKVILSTNIAESSVTINDVTVVLDTGLQRESVYDPRARMSSLETVWVSSSNAVQRKGRAGRVKPGRVIRTFSKKQFEVMLPSPAAEMQRCDLGQACLQTVALGRDPHQFLAEAPDAPDPISIESAMDELACIDAVEGVDPPKLMPVGEVLSKLPLEPLLGRAAMLGTLLGVPELAAAMIVVTAGKSPWLAICNKQEQMIKRKGFCNWSDSLGAAQALLKWEDKIRKSGEKAALQWASEHYLNPTQLATFTRTKAQLLRDMRRAGLIMEEPGRKRKRTTAKAVLADVQADESPTSLLEALDKEDEEEAASSAVNVVTGGIGSENEPLLVSTLCAAFPSSLALQPHSAASVLVAHNLTNTVIAAASVNVINKRAPRYPKPGEDMGGNVWWLYGDAQASHGGNRSFLSNTTRLEEWQVGLFGGMNWQTFSMAEGSDSPALELDGWLTVRAQSPECTRLMVDLRKELRDALNWQALAAVSNDSTATAAVWSLGLRIRTIISLLAGHPVQDSTLKALKGWTPPEIKPPEHPEPEAETAQAELQPVAKAKAKAKGKAKGKAKAAPKASEDSEGATAFPFTEDFLRGQRVAQLKELCKEKGLVVGGTKSQLMERLLECA